MHPLELVQGSELSVAQVPQQSKQAMASKFHNLEIGTLDQKLNILAQEARAHHPLPHTLEEITSRWA